MIGTEVIQSGVKHWLRHCSLVVSAVNRVFNAEDALLRLSNKIAKSLFPG